MDMNRALSSERSIYASDRFDNWKFYRWWRLRVVGSVDHERVVERIVEDSGWSPRYIFMTMMSAGIAVLGLLLSSPAVVIGAMLISPLMSPILGLGFSLALFDFSEMRRSFTALAIGTLAAILFTALIVVVSPLKAPTTEILSRTKPNLFDLLVALFAALAGAFAVIRGRGESIVGVAIATALMPPLAVVGYGIATMNMPVLGGSLALFVTNFLTIALSATIMARFYGFGHYLSGTQSWTQTMVLLLVFGGMAVPLGIALSHIAGETYTATQVRSFLNSSFGSNARVTQLDIDFSDDPIAVRSVIIAPRNSAKDSKRLQRELAKTLGQPVRLQLDQVLLDPSAGSLETQRAELRQASASVEAADAQARAVARLVGLAAGVSADAVTLDRDHRRATASAKPLPGADAATYYALEQRTNEAVSEGWQIVIVPPLGPLPVIRFADNDAALDAAAQRALQLTIWEAQRWNISALGVPGLVPADAVPARPRLNQRRGLAIAEYLKNTGVAAVPAPEAGQNFALSPAAQVNP